MKAIVTLAIGKAMAERWHAVCEPRWKRYCERHGYDLHCLEQPLDTSERARGRSPAWQKLLILSQPFAQEYEQVVWVDADVLANPHAPSIVEGVPVEHVGAVDEYALPDRETHARTLAKLYRHWEAAGIPYEDNPTAPEYYRRFGFDTTFESVVQTGVMVFSPSHHRELLEEVYARYEDKGPGFNYEMRPLSHELLRAGVVTWIDPRFNYIWGHYKALHYPFLIPRDDHPRAAECAAAALADVHFMHFTGSVGEMRAASDAAPAKPRRTGAPGGVRTPVALLVYRRPELTAALVDIVRAARPSTVLVVADGPPNERVREIVENADFGCKVLTNYSDENLGLKRRIESGLDWVFDNVDEAIVLEDDCHPHPSFFAYCDELLARYRDEPRVTTISGSNFGQYADTSYLFSRYPLITGWATWSAAWRSHSRDLAEWPELRESEWLPELLGDPLAAQYWTHIFDRARALEHTWDAGWLFGNWRAGGLAAIPSMNLVTNRGFGEGATNTPAEHAGVFADVPALPVEWPLLHPQRIERDAAADTLLEDVMYSGNISRMFQRVRAAR